MGGLTLLNSPARSTRWTTPAPRFEATPRTPAGRATSAPSHAQSDYNLPVANITSLVYELPFGRGRRFMSDANSFVDGVLGGWQVSGINTMQAGTPFNITYGPNSAQAVSPQIAATYRGANEYRPNLVPGQAVTQGRTSRAANTGYVNYINFNAFVLPPIKDVNGAMLAPSATPAATPDAPRPFTKPTWRSIRSSPRQSKA